MYNDMFSRKLCWQNQPIRINLSGNCYGVIYIAILYPQIVSGNMFLFFFNKDICILYSYIYNMYNIFYLQNNVH